MLWCFGIYKVNSSAPDLFWMSKYFYCKLWTSSTLDLWRDKIWSIFDQKEWRWTLILLNWEPTCQQFASVRSFSAVFKFKFRILSGYINPAPFDQKSFNSCLSTSQELKKSRVWNKIFSCCFMNSWRYS